MMIWRHDSILQINKHLLPSQCAEITMTLEKTKLEPKLLLRNFRTFQYSETTEENQIRSNKRQKSRSLTLSHDTAHVNRMYWVYHQNVSHQKELWPIAREKRNAYNEWEGWLSLQVFIVICLFALRPPPFPIASGTKSRPVQPTEWLALTYWRLSASSSNYYLPLLLAAAAPGPAGPAGACQWHWVQTP